MTIPILETKILYRALLRKVRPDLMFDIGSCDGRDAIRMAKIVPESRVVAFEANPVNHHDIIHTPEIHRSGVEVFNLAVQDVDGSLSFNVVDIGQATTRGTSSIYAKPDANVNSVHVQGVRLDSFVVQHYPESRKMALWIDVEGAGFNVLSGITEIAKRVAFFQIEVEEREIWQGQKLKDDVIALARELGFTLVARGAGGLQYDLVFINPDIVGAEQFRPLLRKVAFICQLRRYSRTLREFKRRWIHKSK